jgi:F0F1-type ATP synthase membrane subunit b/b'
MLKEVKQEVAGLVIQATEKILQEKLSDQEQATLVAKAIKQINATKS